jgi:hypothetical protein
LEILKRIYWGRIFRQENNINIDHRKAGRGVETAFHWLKRETAHRTKGEAQHIHKTCTRQLRSNDTIISSNIKSDISEAEKRNSFITEQLVTYFSTLYA